MSDAQQQAQRRYLKSEGGREAQRRAQAAYIRTAAGRAAQKAARDRYRARQRHAPGCHTEEEWQAVLAAADACHWCGGASAALERDHVIPLSRGGADDITNIAAACPRCNREKRDRLPEEWQR